MKKGYRIEIQKNLTELEHVVAQEYCDEFIQEVLANNGNWNHLSRGGWSHGLPISRGEHGKLLYSYNKDKKYEPNGLVFRRLSSNKRIFGVVHRDLLVSKEDGKRGEQIKNSSCPCRECLGGTKVSMDSVETYVYHEEGDIKG